MRVRTNINTYDICWLNHVKGGVIGTFYEPESKAELIELCRSLYKEGKNFDIIGYTSNIYFLPSYCVDIMVSTRKVNQYQELEDYIIADCGVSVSKLSRVMVAKGVNGFEGLVDLPGTVGASVYGNASCYSCSINTLLESFEFLTTDGELKEMPLEDLALSTRSSSVKRGELTGVILSVKMRKQYGNIESIRKKAKENHDKRSATQPGPKDNLGSIYKGVPHLTLINMILIGLSKISAYILCLFSKNKPIKTIQKEIFFALLGSSDLLPYVHSWNRFIWKDEKSHELFWKYHKIHQRLFSEMSFEIEIKGVK